MSVVMLTPPAINRSNCRPVTICYAECIKGVSSRMTFVKGQSGNPLGRPKGIISQRQRLINGMRKHCDVDAEEFLFQMMHDAITSGDTGILRLALEQYLGKPHQTSENVNYNANTALDAQEAVERLQSTEKGRELLRIVEGGSGESAASRAS